MAAERNFLVGETVHLRVTVSQPGTRTPANPAQGVTLIRLSRNRTAVALPTVSSFTKAQDGYYVLVLATAGMQAGTYTWMARAKDSDQAISLIEDTFSLIEPQSVA